MPACGEMARWRGGREMARRKISSSVHGALAELIGEVSRRDGGVGDTVSTPSSRCATPPMCSANRGRHLASRQCGGSLVGMQKISSSVHGASAELIGEVSRRDGGVREYLFNQSEPPRHVVPLPLCASQTGGDNHGVRYTVSTPSSRCATPPMCFANRGRHLADSGGSSDRKDAWSGSETPRNMYKATEANRV